MRDGDHYIVDGSKAFISGGAVSDVYLVMCRAEDGVVCLMIEDGTPGFTFGKNEDKMGWKCQPTCSLTFEGVRGT